MSNSSASKQYVTIKSAAQTLRLYYLSRKPVLISGPQGIGKSQITAAFASEIGAHIEDIRMSQFESVDLRGLPGVTDGVTVWNVPNFFHRISDITDRPVILFLDEFLDAQPSVFAACYQLVLDRALGDFKLGENVYVIAASNEPGPGSITRKPSKALADRFAHIYVEADLDAFISHVTETGEVHPDVRAFLGYRPGYLHELTMDEVPTDNYATPSPRSWIDVSRLIEAFRKSNAQTRTFDDNTLWRAIAGLVGEGTAASLSAFLDVRKECPTYEEIIASPNSARTFDNSKAAMAWATAAMVADRTGPKDFDRAVTYAKRLSPEFRAMIMQDAPNRLPELRQTNAYRDWCVEIADA